MFNNQNSMSKRFVDSEDDARITSHVDSKWLDDKENGSNVYDGVKELRPTKSDEYHTKSQFERSMLRKQDIDKSFSRLTPISSKSPGTQFESVRKRDKQDESESGATSTFDMKMGTGVGFQEPMRRSKAENNASSTNDFLPNMVIKSPDQALAARCKYLSNKLSQRIPEVHFIGEVCCSFGYETSTLSCKWSIEWGDSWTYLEGEYDGQTQYSIQSDNGICIWNHPIDIHLKTTSVKGWPRLIVELWKIDKYGLCTPVGYGFTHLPSNAGNHDIIINCWRPQGSHLDELNSFFLGSSIQLNRKSTISTEAWENRHRIVSVTTAKVRMNITLVKRNFEDKLKSR